MKRTTIFAMLAVFGLLLTGTHAIAAGTTANTAVSNQATLDYKVGGVPQTQIDSDDPNVGGTTDPTIFRVDRKIDLTVAETGDQTAYPEQARAAIRFSVTNNSNDTLDFALNAENILGDTLAGAGLTSTEVEIVVDNGDDSYSDADDNGTFINDLAADTSIDVWVVVSIPAGAANGLIDTWALLAEATDDGSIASPVILANTGSNTISSEDTVLADAAGPAAADGLQDAAHSDSGNFVISATTLTVAKRVDVVDDGIDTSGDTNTANDPVEYAVPGAIMEYTVTITNTGAVDSTELIFNDDLSLEIGEGDIVWVDESITLNLNGTGATGLSDTTDGDSGEFQSDNVKVTIATLPAGENAVIKFRVTIFTP